MRLSKSSFQASVITHFNPHRPPGAGQSVGARAAAQSLEKVCLELTAKRLKGEARLQQ